MSRPIQHEIVCSQCRRPFSVTLWTSVNAGLDPKLKKDLMQRRLFQFPCPGCRTTMDCEYDVLYHDPEKSVMVWLKHPEEDGIVSMSAEPLDIVETILTAYQLRLVTTFGGLIEKIHCFDNDFDDRVVEFLKSIVYHKQYGRMLDHDAEFYFTGQRKRLFRKAEMDFVSVSSAGEQSYHVPLVPIYDEIAQQFRGICQTPPPSGEWLLVNQKYLMDLISS